VYSFGEKNQTLIFLANVVPSADVPAAVRAGTVVVQEQTRTQVRQGNKGESRARGADNGRKR
jgi:lipopolysaccharide export system protein LptA